jgi:hypothetical protein
MKRSRKNSLNSGYNPVSRMFENAFGKFSTYTKLDDNSGNVRNVVKCSRIIDY